MFRYFHFQPPASIGEGASGPIRQFSADKKFDLQDKRGIENTRFGLPVRSLHRERPVLRQVQGMMANFQLAPDAFVRLDDHSLIIDEVKTNFSHAQILAARAVAHRLISDEGTSS